MTTPGAGYRVSNLILRVADLPRALAFYRDTLGMGVRFASDEFAFLDGGGIALVLNKPEAPPAQASAGLAALTEVVLEVDDVRARYAELEKRGVPFSREPRPVTSDAQRDLLATDFRDPDGHVLSLTGWVPRPAR
jgi:catechol 2,3-dioxygenase-like lactoylglutathione lyase family enzyme